MFNIAKLPRVTRPIPLTIEVDGQLEEHPFTATFQIIEVDQSTPEKISDEAGQRAFLQQVVVDLGDVADEHGAPIAFSPELKAAVINRFDCRMALTRAYFDAVQKLAAGN